VRIRVIKVGRPAEKDFQRLVDRYIRRLESIYRVESMVLKSSDPADLFQRLELRADRSRPEPGQVVVALDERGQSLSSPDVARFLRGCLDEGGIKRLDFVIGGPYGLPEPLRQSCQHLWRLSDMVLPSDVAWLMMWEQLYRAHSILTGSKYHHA
jgi:23S rRNA (pseudouridine1915-N3)-methyltransferase